MPATSTLQPDRYHRGDTGDFRQVDGSSNDDPVLGWAGGVVYRNVARSTVHSNTTTEAAFDTSFTIPANTLKAGSVIKVRFQGIATSVNSTDTITIKLYIGGITGTAILTGTATDATANDIFTGEATIVIRTIGATGTFVAVASGNIVPAATRVAVPDYQITASTTIDTTAAQDIAVGCDWSVAHADNDAFLDIMVVEIY
jgi:hypothetical protein